MDRAQSKALDANSSRFIFCRLAINVIEAGAVRGEGCNNSILTERGSGYNTRRGTKKHFSAVHAQVLYASDLGLSFSSRHRGTHSGWVDELSTFAA